MANAAILCRELERIGWSVECRNAFIDERFDSSQSLNNMTQLCLKTVCKLIRSAPDPVRTGIYQKHKINALHLWVTTWLSQGQTAQGQQYTDTTALEYAAKVCHLKEERKDDDKRMVNLPDTFGNETNWKMFKKMMKNYLATN